MVFRIIFPFFRRKFMTRDHDYFLFHTLSFLCF
nr:MAG TPA: hypothetical protein [Bacteriophage sp.]